MFRPTGSTTGQKTVSRPFPDLTYLRYSTGADEQLTPVPSGLQHPFLSPSESVVGELLEFVGGEFGAPYCARGRNAPLEGP
ncbi:hypothetical protein GCM10010103_62030 [Streptomyces paradoxus]